MVIFSIWIHGEEALLEFVNHLNTIDYTIKFAANYSSVSVNFLEVKVSCDTDGSISTDLLSNVLIHINF